MVTSAPSRFQPTKPNTSAAARSATSTPITKTAFIAPTHLCTEKPVIILCPIPTGRIAVLLRVSVLSGDSPCSPSRIALMSRRFFRPLALQLSDCTGTHMSGDIKKIVLAYSGGLDTSVILRWLQETYSCEVVTFTADIGQGEELEPARAKAELMGAAPIFVEDLRETFVRDYVFPMFRANALYEGSYLLGTSIARPLIAKRLVEIAAEVGADAIAH